jgi:hypothetical protein
MKFNKWTVGLAAVGVVSLASAARADEKVIPLQTALSNTTISGYVDTAAEWNPGTDQNPNGGPRLPGYSYAKNDGFSLNAVDIAIDKPEDESPWAAGYHVEMMFGPNNPVGISYVNSIGLNEIRQAFLRLRMPVGNGIDWQVGVWDTIVGYESNSDPLNPNYTRSYGYTIEPTTHTGILATYKVNDIITLQAGIADGSNVGGGPAGFNGTSAIESQKAYMGDIQFTAPDSAGFIKGATMTVAVIDSAGQGAAAGSTSYYAGATIPTPMSALKVGACFDYLDEHDGGVTGNSANDSIWNLALYSTFQATDKLSFNLRAEYLDDQDAGAGAATSVYPLNTGEEFTVTTQYNLWANVISRVEFRWDHVEHGNAFGANNSPGGPAFRGNDFLLALNLIYQF